MVEKRIESNKANGGTIVIMETGHDYDFIASIINDSDQTLTIFVEDSDDGLEYEPFEVAPNDWVGLLANDEGRGILKCIKNGDFEAVLE